MRPFVGKAAYVNNADADLAKFAVHYWGINLPRLRRIRSAIDPANIFRHALSVLPGD